MTFSLHFIVSAQKSQLNILTYAYAGQHCKLSIMIFGEDERNVEIMFAHAKASKLRTSDRVPG
jgi:hypothetical protein